MQWFLTSFSAVSHASFVLFWSEQSANNDMDSVIWQTLDMHPLGPSLCPITFYELSPWNPSSLKVWFAPWTPWKKRLPVFWFEYSWNGEIFAPFFIERSSLFSFWIFTLDKYAKLMTIEHGDCRATEAEPGKSEVSVGKFSKLVE